MLNISSVLDLEIGLSPHRGVLRYSRSSGVGGGSVNGAYVGGGSVVNG